VLAERCQDRHGLHVPRDVALVCSGMHIRGGEHPSLKITSLDLPFEKAGQTAAEMLGKLMAGEDVPSRPFLLEPGEVVSRESTDVTAADDPLVADAMRFMAEQCHRPIKVMDVADAVSIGRRTLEKRFRAVLDRTVAGQIEHMRVERAKRMLVQSREATKSIAVRCGYSSGQQLYLAFLRREGKTPRQYRKENAGRYL
jgi:LacI family transcriptional regulator